MGISKAFSGWLLSTGPLVTPRGSSCLPLPIGDLLEKSGKLWPVEGNDLFIFLSPEPRREISRAETRSDSSECPVPQKISEHIQMPFE